ncbi:MAG: thiamine phosphate synthase [Lachnospiraceae bacterium]|nr:thiamine phosphate synthase [Lachnospiraceae bacterium]
MNAYLKNHPQVHIINNYITVTDAVNAILAVGGTAVGADFPEETAEIAAMSDALVLNTGTPSEERKKAYLAAGKAANEKGIPVILDPVGVGASDFRKKMIKDLLEEVKVTCVRGNSAEIRTLCELFGTPEKEADEKEAFKEAKGSDPAKGVEASGEGANEKSLLSLSEKLGAVIVESGEKVRFVSASEGLFEVLPGGCEMQKRFTGAGCMMTAVLGAFLGNAKKSGGNLTEAVRDGILLYSRAARKAEVRCIMEGRRGTASFKTLLLDTLSMAGEAWRKQFSEADLSLYAVTDRGCLKNGRDLAGAVTEALFGGVSLVQLREKHLSEAETVEKAKVVKEVCDEFHVPLIINDSTDVCLKVGAAGVHLGQEDGSIVKAREILGKDRIIGATAHNLEEALKAEADGADYLGVGAAFGSATKLDAKPVTSLEMYKEITKAVSIPVVAIGGINSGNVERLGGSGISGVAVVSGIFGEDNVERAAKILKEKVMEEILK